MSSGFRTNICIITPNTSPSSGYIYFARNNILLNTKKWNLVHCCGFGTSFSTPEPLSIPRL